MIQELLDKNKITGVRFWTFGVEHCELEENTVQYEKNAKVPNFRINKTLLGFGAIEIAYRASVRLRSHIELRCD